jgi:hypothetical protein
VRHGILEGMRARLRFTLLYGVLFLVSGFALLIITNLLVLGPIQISQTAPAGTQGASSALAAANARIAGLEQEIGTFRERQARQLLIGSGVALAVMAGVSVVLGRAVAGRVLRPLRTITATTRRISADNLHERLAVPGPSDEVKDLADTIDGLLERLEGAFAAQRRFVANASHELRTPLTTMRASLDVAVAKPEPLPPTALALADRLRTELDQIDRLLDGFLMLARTQHGDLADRSPVCLDSLVSAALAAQPHGLDDLESTVKATLGGRKLTVTADLQPAWTFGSHTLLARLVDNIVSNAVVHNIDDGWIRASTSTTDSAALLVLETSGPVLDPAHVARLGQPFQRLGADRTGAGNGTGLGLSIVSAIASAHGGHLDLQARPGGGLRATISLPRWERA